MDRSRQGLLAFIAATLMATAMLGSSVSRASIQASKVASLEVENTAALSSFGTLKHFADQMQSSGELKSLQERAKSTLHSLKQAQSSGNANDFKDAKIKAEEVLRSIGNHVKGALAAGKETAEKAAAEANERGAQAVHTATQTGKSAIQKDETRIKEALGSAHAAARKTVESAKEHAQSKAAAVARAATSKINKIEQALRHSATSPSATVNLATARSALSKATGAVAKVTRPDVCLEMKCFSQTSALAMKMTTATKFDPLGCLSNVKLGVSPASCLKGPLDNAELTALRQCAVCQGCITGSRVGLSCSQYGNGWNRGGAGGGRTNEGSVALGGGLSNSSGRAGSYDYSKYIPSTKGQFNFSKYIPSSNSGSGGGSFNYSKYIPNGGGAGPQRH